MIDSHVHLTPTSRCTNCGKAADRADNATPGEQQEPGPGAIAVCLYCHHVMVYGDDMSLRDPTKDELYKIAGDPELLRAMRLLAKFKRTRR